MNRQLIAYRKTLNMSQTDMAKAIGMCLTRITNAILNNENSIITVSTYDSTNDVYISLPCVINENGIKEKVFVTLNENETYKLQNSINIIKDTIQNVK